MSRRAIESIKDALKLISGVEESSKGEGLQLIDKVLSDKESLKQLTELGYDQVVFKELMKLVQFESGQTLKLSLDTLEKYYFDRSGLLDEMAETMIYRVARTNDTQICALCLDKIENLVDRFDHSIAKHSKQLLKLADLNEDIDLNPVLVKILLKMEKKLPKRKTAASQSD